MKIIYPILLVLISSINVCAQDTLSATYPISVPTAFHNPPIDNPNCKATLTMTLPGTDSIDVVGMIVNYTMTADNGGSVADQRSKIHCVNNNTSESTFAVGSAPSGSTATYSRSIAIANGTYAGGAMLSFEIWPQRVIEIAGGCIPDIQRVDFGSWTIDLIYNTVSQPTPKVGINISQPSAMLDVNGKLKVGDDTDDPIEGMIRYNSSTTDFEGYNGTEWLSLSASNGSQNGNNPPPTPPDSSAWGMSSSCPTSSALVFYKFTQIGEPVAFGEAFDVSGDWAISTLTNSAIGGQDEIFISNSTSFQVASFFETGISVAIDGLNAMVGKANSVLYYKYSSALQTWALEETILHPTGNSTADFGRAVDILGDRLVIGAPLDDTNGHTDNGSIHIYEKVGTNWLLLESISASNAGAGDKFGSSVKFGGDHLIAGAPDRGASGAVYTFEKSGSNFIETAMLIPAGMTTDNQIGLMNQIDINNNFATVGYTNSGASQDSLQVAIYENNAGVWTESDNIKFLKEGFTSGNPGLSLEDHTLAINNYVLVNDGTSWEINSRFSTCSNFGNDVGPSYHVVNNQSIYTRQIRPLIGCSSEEIYEGYVLKYEN